MTALFDPCQAGELKLNHRIVLAPMTRYRCTTNQMAPNAMMAEYYAQRASVGGLLIAEATYISPEGTPSGIFTRPFVTVAGIRRVSGPTNRRPLSTR